MQNFDELLDQELKFEIRQQTFTMQWVKPEILAEFEDEDSDGSAQASLGKMDDLIVKFLVPEDVERWKELRAREEDPVTFGQLRAILRWAVEAQSSRPTEAPSRSRRGRGSTARSSGGSTD